MLAFGLHNFAFIVVEYKEVSNHDANILVLRNVAAAFAVLVWNIGTLVTFSENSFLVFGVRDSSTLAHWNCQCKQKSNDKHKIHS